MNYGKKATMQLLRKYDNKSSKVKNKFKLIVLKILLVVVIVAGAAGISSGIGVMKGIIDSAPDISKIDVTPTGYSTTVLAANGEETATLVGQGANRQYVTIDEIPLDLQHAFVAIEDERFYNHSGVDLQGILRAVFSALSDEKMTQGARTITQQLLKNQVFGGGNEKSFYSPGSQHNNTAAHQEQRTDQLDKRNFLCRKASEKDSGAVPCP